MIAGADTYDMLGDPNYDVQHPFVPPVWTGLTRALLSAETTLHGEAVSFSDAMYAAVNGARELSYRHGRCVFVGNGGSAGICSHMALDYTKAGGVPSLCFNDPASLTAWANDAGYDQVFARPIAAHCHKPDLLFAISSSGESASILNAVAAAKQKDMAVITLSGFKPANRLRTLGDLNFYVPSDKYGLVEVAHHAILHAILDQVVAARG